jgi:hypothetical protein
MTMKRYLILTLVAALSAGAAGCGGKPTDTGTPPVAALPTSAAAQSDDKAYCAQLGALASRFVGSAGAEGRQVADLNVLGAITDCDRGRYDKGIPYLERRLRGAGVTLPSR